MLPASVQKGTPDCQAAAAPCSAVMRPRRLYSWNLDLWPLCLWHACPGRVHRGDLRPQDVHPEDVARRTYALSSWPVQAGAAGRPCPRPSQARLPQVRTRAAAAHPVPRNAALLQYPHQYRAGDAGTETGADALLRALPRCASGPGDSPRPGLRQSGAAQRGPRARGCSRTSRMQAAAWALSSAPGIAKTVSQPQRRAASLAENSKTLKRNRV